MYKICFNRVCIHRNKEIEPQDQTKEKVIYQNVPTSNNPHLIKFIWLINDNLI